MTQARAPRVTSIAVRAVGVAGALALVCAAAVLGLRHEAAPGPDGDGSDVPLSGAAPARHPEEAGTAAPGGMSWLAAATDAIAAQRAALVVQLRASRDPADALRLYDLLEGCREFRRGTSSDAAACDGLSDEAMAGRLDALQRAVQGRAPGAVARLYEAGPEGDFVHDPGHRERDAWRARLEPLLEDAVRHGDIAALSASMLEYDIGIDFPRDPVRALTCVMVAMDIERERGRTVGGLALQAARLSAELTGPQRSIAALQAQRLFVAAFQGKPAQ